MLGIAPSEFWYMTPAALSAASEEHKAHSDATRKSDDYRAGVVASTIGQAHGGKNLTPATWFPSLQLSPEEQAERVAAQWKQFVTIHNQTEGANGAA